MITSIRHKILLFFILTGAVLGALSVVLWLAVDNAHTLNEAQQRRYDSYRLADEMRQSSDDLTRLVRTYVVTGDERFKQYYEDVVAIREGWMPRPENYRNIYWDFVTASHQRDTAAGDKIPLFTLMQNLGFTEAELAKLEESKRLSDEMITMEIQAMNALQGRFRNGQGEFSRLGLPNKELARKIIHGPTYHRAKADIMRPISDFFDMVDTRTRNEVAAVDSRQNQLLTMAISLSVSLLSLFVFGYLRAKQLIVDPLISLTQSVNEMEKGNYSVQIQTGGKDELGTLSHAFISLSNIISRQIDELRHRADHDPLTGALARQATDERLQFCMRNAKRTNSRVGILFLDIDDFKLVNDHYGHQFGDIALTEVVARCKSALRETDCVCRVGGDEFMIILPNVEGRKDVELIAKKIGSTFKTPVQNADHCVVLSVSIGSATYPSDGDSIQSITRQADQRMYSTKQQRQAQNRRLESA